MRNVEKTLRVTAKHEPAGWLSFELTDVGTTQLVASVPDFASAVDRAQRNGQRLQVEAAVYESWVADGSAPKTPPENVTIV